MKKENKAYYQKNPYSFETANDGKKYVAWDSVIPTLNLSDGNSKVGKVICFNLPIFYTCVHDCECYTGGKCYADGGCYNFASNQATYSENYAFYRSCTKEQFIDAMCAEIATYKNARLMRYFTCGDIPNIAFIDCIVEIARRFPGIKFWTYTKKYRFVNHWVDVNGLDSIPENLRIVFSHWRNDDGTYYDMPNPYQFPTSEFIPAGCEELAKHVTHICPCSDPESIEHCDTCTHACYDLKFGESMALLEHSTSATKDRDKELKAAKEKLEKAAKKAGKAA